MQSTHMRDTEVNNVIEDVEAERHVNSHSKQKVPHTLAKNCIDKEAIRKPRVIGVETFVQGVEHLYNTFTTPVRGTTHL